MDFVSEIFLVQANFQRSCLRFVSSCWLGDKNKLLVQSTCHKKIQTSKTVGQNFSLQSFNSETPFSMITTFQPGMVSKTYHCQAHGFPKNITQFSGNVGDWGGGPHFEKRLASSSINLFFNAGAHPALAESIFLSCFLLFAFFVCHEGQ